MNKFTKKELVDLILYNFKKKEKKAVRKKIKEYIQPNYDRVYEENIDDLNDFNLHHGLKYLNSELPKLELKIDNDERDFLKEFDDMMKQLENTSENQKDWFDIDFGAGKKSIIQSVLVPKATFTKKQAIQYIKKHFKFIKIDDKPLNYYRFRQFKPTKGSKYSTKNLNNGVKLIFEYKKYGGSVPVHTIYQSIKNSYAYPKIEDINSGFVFSKYGSDKEIQLYVNEKEKRIIINFIGTYKTIDWTNNLSYVLGNYKNTKRFKHARDAFLKIINDYPNYQVILIGHSQSAVITRLLNEEFHNKIFEVINLNGANLGEDEMSNEYNIRSKMDLVSLLKKPSSRDVIINNKTHNIITEHSPEILKRLIQERQIGRPNLQYY